MEPREDDRWTLSEEAAREANEAHAAVVDEFLTPETMPPNTVGMGVGVKLVGGEPTGEPALMVLVTQKLPREALAEHDLIPGELGGMQTDVLEVGYVRPGFTQQPGLTQRFRPARGGCSVGNARALNQLTGTIATGVYDSVAGGAGIIPAYYLLSNNHVLARSNLGTPGDPIIQPGLLDGGSDPRDRIATLTSFVPLQIFPPDPLATHRNFADAAIAEVERFDDLDREIYWSGPVRGFEAQLRFNTNLIGLRVKKTGRTTNFSLGRITAINTTIDITGYEVVGVPGFGGTARFTQQITTTGMMSNGDSGSLLTTAPVVPSQSLDNVAVGLLFAFGTTGGTTAASFANPIWYVQNLLGVRVAETVVIL